ncbi:hypothetical protein ACTXG6_43495 [Pseudonocardia sp. Cha107L01]|uniref:hypothetical protein n=1 Tax=Pseudonocardia sp. Cha107L01 TaxID=3457576 RepID=UPI00403E812F
MAVQTRVMAWWQPVTPEWVQPSTYEVSDLHALAYRVFNDTRSPRTAGMVAALSWVRGGRDAPITGREAQPVTRGAASYERWAAQAVLDEGGELPAPPLESFARSLRVPYLAPRPVGRAWAEGVWPILSWLEGSTGHQSPLPLPRRSTDGTLWGREEMREKLITDNPQRWLDPATRRHVEVEAAEQAQRNRDLADVIAQTRAQFGPPKTAAPRPAERRYVYRPSAAN